MFSFFLLTTSFSKILMSFFFTIWPASHCHKNICPGEAQTQLFVILMDYPISAGRDHMRGLCTLPFLRSHLWLYVIWLFIVDFLFGCPLKPGEANVTCYFSLVGQDPGPRSILSCKCFLLLAPGRCFFFAWLLHTLLATSLVTQTVKCLPATRETQVQSLDGEDPLEKEMATHSSTLAWKILWTEEPCRLQFMGSQGVGHDWVTSLHFLILCCPQVPSPFLMNLQLESQGRTHFGKSVWEIWN